MKKYKTLLSTVAILAVMSGCNSASSDEKSSQNSPSAKTELTTNSIEKNDEVYAVEDSLVSSLNKRAVSVSEGEFIQTSIDELVPALVKAYVPSAYEKEILAIEALQSESLQANEAFIKQLQAFYELSNEETTQRAANVSDLYDIIASISGQIYDIIYAYLFGDSTIGDVYDGVVDTLFTDHSSSSSLSSASTSLQSSSSSAISSSSEMVTNSSSSVNATLSSSSSSTSVVDDVVDSVGDAIDSVTDAITGSSGSTSSGANSSSSATIIDEVVDGVGDVIGGVTDALTGGSGASSSSTTTTSQSSSSDAVSSQAQSSSSSANTLDSTALAPFISITDIPEVSSWSYPKVYFNNYVITSYDRIEGNIAEGEAVLAKVLIPAGVTKVTMKSSGRSDFMNGLLYGAFGDDVGSYCGENRACSKEALVNVTLSGGFFSSGDWSDTLYEGEALNVPQYRYVVFYNEKGGSDDFSSMKTKITIGNKDYYNSWRDSAIK